MMLDEFYDDEKAGELFKGHADAFPNNAKAKLLQDIANDRLKATAHFEDVQQLGKIRVSD
jgi:hypothetical protein